MKFRFLILFCAFCIAGQVAYAMCAGSWHTPGTSGSSELCQQQYKLKQELEEAKQKKLIKERKKEHAEKLKAINTPSVSSKSSGNSIVQNFTEAIGGSSGSGANSEPEYISPIADTMHQFELGFSAYIFPSMAGFERQMPELRPNEFAWVYNLSKAFAVGGMYQVFNLKGSQFDPITEDREVTETIEVVDPDTGEITLGTRKVTKSFTVYQPGAQSANYTRFLYFAQISGEVGPEYAAYARLGSGMSKAKVKYTVVDADGKESFEEEEYDSQQPWLFEAGLRTLFGGINTGFYTRIVEGDNGESDYLKYIDMTTIEFGVNVTFGLPTLGML